MRWLNNAQVIHYIPSIIYYKPSVPRGSGEPRARTKKDPFVFRERNAAYGFQLLTIETPKSKRTRYNTCRTYTASVRPYVCTYVRTHAEQSMSTKKRLRESGMPKRRKIQKKTRWKMTPLLTRESSPPFVQQYVGSDGYCNVVYDQVDYYCN